ncbi:MAG: SIS domain-containing protein [Planctomycetota bacterium]
MEPEAVVEARLTESARTKERLLESQKAAIVAAAEVLAEAVRARKKILWCGNGGSAADSQHFATELVVRLSSDFERPALASLALTTDTSLLTACANDYSFERIFARQVEALGQEGDVLVGITTSGNSKNVLAALEEAGRRGMRRVLFSAGEGGTCRAQADAAVLVPSTVTSHIQECHLAIGHIVCELIERMACGRDA